ncbi:MAG: Endonuclease V [Methanomassiliicoccales archaeon PtaU1.Bin124]|nr:MAG: Endonuclease V [Methanomassiliicoccales archaeon PtaU1.Bin124]
MTGSLRELEGFDLIELIYQATCQVPEGMVSTYGDIAKAIGDVRAARAVGAILSRYPRRDTPVPCHRIVYGDGRVGWYNGLGKGTDEKSGRLEAEGVHLKHGMVMEFGTTRFQDFRVRPVLKEMRDEQERMARKVKEKGPAHFRYAIGLDVSYADDRDAFAAAVIYDLESGKVEERTTKCAIDFPYIPTYLGFREVPVVAPLLKDIEDAVLLVDGQGRLHPRCFGIACHLGVRFGIPTVGVAKSHLTGEVGDDGSITLEGRVTGKKVRARGKEYYVSVGNQITLQDAVSMAETCLSAPESDVLRRAHVAANRFRRECG